jgi:dolichol-phosphate mannosyltransferase
MKKTISIILPTYNEAGNIGKLINSIFRVFKPTNFHLEIIVVDDNSPDGTAKVVKNHPVKLLIRKNTRGLATAVLHGIKHSTGQIVVLMDTDFNHQPKDILRLVSTLILEKADLVIGSRYMAGGGMHLTEASTFQFYASKLGNYFVNRILLGLPVHESLSGFLAFRKKTLTGLKLNSIFQGYGDYCIRLLFNVHQKNQKIFEIPVVYGKRQWGESKSHLGAMFIEYFKTAISLKFFS